MTDKTDGFNVSGFYRAVDSTRQSRGLTWKQVGSEASVSPSTLARMGKDKSPDAEGLASLGAWAGLNPSDFVERGARPKPAEETLAVITRALHADPNLDQAQAEMIDEIVKTAYRRSLATKG